MHVFKLKNNRLNNRDINIDQNNRDYDFSHNRAALASSDHNGLERHNVNVGIHLPATSEQ